MDKDKLLKLVDKVAKSKRHITGLVSEYELSEPGTAHEIECLGNLHYANINFNHLIADLKKEIENEC